MAWAELSIDCDGDGPRRLHTVRRGADVLGFVAIDSTVSGRARGGLRMLPDVAADELRAAARTMTLKYGFLGLSQGGAKAGIRADGEGDIETKRLRLREFAGAIEPLLRDRLYVPDSDMGVSAADVRWMMQSIDLPVGRRDWRRNRSGHYTALSCLAAARATLAHRGVPLAGCRAAIEGFGRVGSALAALLRREGVTIVAVSTSRGALFNDRGLDEQLLRLASEFGSAVVERYDGADRLDREALLELPVDLLCPCARYHGIHTGNAPRVAARVVCAGANDPVEPAAEQTLWGRGVTCPPDFISNCGGVLGGTLEFAGVAPLRIADVIDGHVARAVTALLARADAQAAPPRAVAEPLALQRHEQARSAAERPGLGGRAVALGLECYRRGWIPEALVAAMAPSYFERRLR